MSITISNIIPTAKWLARRRRRSARFWYKPQVYAVDSVGNTYRVVNVYVDGNLERAMSPTEANKFIMNIRFDYRRDIMLHSVSGRKLTLIDWHGRTL